MWIKKLELKNFQAHKNTVIDFNDQFNCIVGPSRAGKSSVVRALNFLFFDNWSDAYVRNGSTFTELVLHLDSGYIISRSKSGGSVVNKIIVTNPDKTQQVYEKFGTDTPEPVRKILQIYPVKIDVDADVEVNVADQDHPPFLLSESGPTKTKYINRLTGSHVLDAAMRSVNKDKSSLLTEKSLISDNVEQLTSKLSRFSNAHTIKDKLSKYHSDCKRIHKQVTLLRKVEVARQDIKSLLLEQL
jgi:predicted ATP-dependent endonuclease of OLD family